MYNRKYDFATCRQESFKEVLFDGKYLGGVSMRNLIHFGVELSSISAIKVLGHNFVDVVADAFDMEIVQGLE
jgi:hypothetical protein